MDVENFLKECTNDAWNFILKMLKKILQTNDQIWNGGKCVNKTVFSFEWFAFIS